MVRKISIITLDDFLRICTTLITLNAVGEFDLTKYALLAIIQ